jgi:HEAT repeat protein
MSVALLAGVVVGCAQNKPNGEKWTDRQVPAPKEPPTPPRVQNVSVSPALQAAARAEIRSGLTSSDGLVRAHAVEAAQNGLGASDKSIFLNGLKDTAPPVRIASAMAIGMLRISEAKPQLQQMINDESPHVQIAVRFALHRLGVTTYSKELEVTARDPRTEIRSSTAMALGMLGEPTAARVLKPMLHDADVPVRLQAAEALWRLGSVEGMRALVAGISSAYVDDQMISLLALAEPRDRRVLGHVEGAITDDHIEVGLVAARAAGMLGSDLGYVVAVEGTKSKDPRQRALAALALGAIGRSDAQAYLGDLLKDRDFPDVRLSAAQAILQLRSPGATARGD